MTTLFNSYKECESVIIQMCNYNDNSNLDRLAMAINVCHSLQDDKEKIWRLSQTFLKTLWNNDEAISKGFHKYFKDESEKIKQMLDYHEKECPKHNCKVCIHEKNIKEKMVKMYERKRPKIYSQ